VNSDSNVQGETHQLEQSNPGQRGTEAILLVEDETFVRTATSEVLQSAGYKVVIAESGAQALDTQFRRPESMELLLADVVMPGMSGFELANQFARLWPGVRVLMMSGYAEQFVSGEAPNRGREYLSKPFSTHTLLKRVLDKNAFGFRTPA
jgi:two-component system, cell cycle sensor histidine kinase and response regulator CckA